MRSGALTAALAAVLFAACSPVRAEWTPAVPKGYRIERIAAVPRARELALASDGTLFVGTDGDEVYAIPHASGRAGEPRVFASFDDPPAAGVAFERGYLYVGTQHAVWRIPYRSGDMHARAAPEKLAAVRTGSPPAGSDGDVHTTTSVAVWRGRIYASVGSSCNACVETDPTRATVGEVKAGRYAVIARRIRNAIALAVDPANGDVWAGDAGQDELSPGHPYEFFDDISARKPPVDYGWPFCYERHEQKPGTHETCDRVAVPLVIFPAYETPIGAVFANGGAYVTLHGSWHGPPQGISAFRRPRVVFIPMRGVSPARAANWNDPQSQWTTFAGGYQEGGSSTRNGRPTGITAGPRGTLYLADDTTDSVYRIGRQ